MAKDIIFYNSDLNVFTAAYMVTHWGYSYVTSFDIIDTLERKSESNGLYDRIEILDHGSPGIASIGRKSTYASSTGLIVHDPGMQMLWTSIGRFMHRTSCLVLNMCEVGKSGEGRVLLQAIQRMTGGIVYGAVKEMKTEIGMHYNYDPRMYRHYLY